MDLQDKVLDKFMKQMNKGGDVIVPSSSPTSTLLRIPFGNTILDVATGGGAPQGKIIRFYGPLSSGKTQNALKIYAVNQHRCRFCWNTKETCTCGNKYRMFRLAFIDLENSWSPQWASSNGILINEDPADPNILVSVPETGEQAMDIVDSLIRLRLANIIIFDSVAQAVPSVELTKSIQDFAGGKVGAHSLVVNAAMRKWQHGLNTRMEQYAPLVVLINQVRETLDQYNPETTPGGRGQGFASALDIRFQRLKYRTDKGVTKGLAEFAPDKGSPVAQLQRFLVAKSKICPSGRVGEFWMWQAKDGDRSPGDIVYGSSLFQYAKHFGVIVKQAGEYIIVETGETLGSKIDSAIEYLEKHPDTQNQVSEFIREAAKDGKGRSSGLDESSEEDS